MNVQVILNEDVPNLGSTGDVVKVRPGYARNYLLPRKLAVEANPRNLRAFEHQKRLAMLKRDAQNTEAVKLKDKLEAIRAMARRLPEDAKALMQRSIDDLRASGILDRVVKVGERAPDFTLPSIDGVPVSLTELLAKGPVVLSFFRGRW